MFGSNGKSEKGPEFNPATVNIINNGTNINGDIVSNGDIRIDGTLSGTITSKSKMVLGQTGSVEGDINAQHADISGIVKGNIFVNELLTLKSTSKVYGDVVTKKIIIEAGAEFNGRCHMKSDKNEAIASTKDARSNGQIAQSTEKVNTAK
jgi:cytoskeletal protein CcmA (bactofilin family)